MPTNEVLEKRGARAAMTRTGRGYAVLVHWDDEWRGTWDEVITWPDGGFTMASAEAVAKECRRLGAKLASVHKERSARRLAKPLEEEL